MNQIQPRLILVRGGIHDMRGQSYQGVPGPSFDLAVVIPGFTPQGFIRHAETAVASATVEPERRFTARWPTRIAGSAKGKS